MEKLFICLLLAGGGRFAKAQALSPQVLASSGASFSSPTVLLDWTAGEAVIPTLGTGTAQLSQGFHQTRLSITALEPALNQGGAVQINVYPSPAHDFVIVESQNGAVELEIRMLDLHGRILIDQVRLQPGERQKLDLSQVAVGQYLVQALTESGQSKGVFRVLKTH